MCNAASIAPEHVVPKGGPLALMVVADDTHVLKLARGAEMYSAFAEVRRRAR